MGENKDYVTYPEGKGSINISEEVIAVLAGSTAVEIDGVAGLYSTPGRDIVELLSKRNMAKGVKIRIEDKMIHADIFIMVEMGSAVNEVGKAVQSAVVTAIESATGLAVAAVNVHICGIDLKK